jgi:hypothetical protein
LEIELKQSGLAVGTSPRDEESVAGFQAFDHCLIETEARAAPLP